MNTPAPRGLNAAFGGVRTTLDEQRAIWLEALHEDAIWEGPMFETPVAFIGRTAVGRFMEFLLETVPEFSTVVHRAWPAGPDGSLAFESTGGGATIFGGRYEQRYFSQVSTRDGKAFRMREYCNPFQTLKAFGAARWAERTAAIMAECNVPWPASQAPDPARLPGF